VTPWRASVADFSTEPLSPGDIWIRKSMARRPRPRSLDYCTGGTKTASRVTGTTRAASLRSSDFSS
jgi:hypothetical protein